MERVGLEGEKSSLFFEFLRILKELRTKYFLLENVVMEDRWASYISRAVGCAPVRINAARIGPAHRDRLYWTNIPGRGVGLLTPIMEQPQALPVEFSSILEKGFWSPKKKGRCLNRSNGGFIKNGYLMFRRWAIGGFSNVVFSDKEAFYRMRRAYYKGCQEEDVYDGLRPLCETELERCHDIPEGYTSILTQRQTEDVVGDGWHIGVAAHILGHLP
jgi:DNA (cytosine-5)-methyltransferase 3A